MNLREQVKYLRKSRGLTQKQTAKASGLSFDMYTKFESGARNLSHVNLEKVMQTLSGTLTVVPYRFEKVEKEEMWVNDPNGPNGVQMSDTLKAVSHLFVEMPNLLMGDEIVLQTTSALEMYMSDVIGSQALAGYRKSCEDRYEFYKEKENSAKDFYEDYTTSLEMLVLDILRKACSLKEFHEVPNDINKLLED